MRRSRVAPGTEFAGEAALRVECVSACCAGPEALLGSLVLVSLLFEFLKVANALQHPLLLLQLLAETEDDAGDSHGQKNRRKDTLKARAIDDGDDGTNGHDHEEAWAVAKDHARSEKRDEVDDDRAASDPMARGKVTLRGKLKGAVLRGYVWFIGRHSTCVASENLEVVEAVANGDYVNNAPHKERYLRVQKQGDEFQAVLIKRRVSEV